ncbi:MAG: hypothetical protein IMY86_13735 [Chloroflexi bacterium]|nr:hypothetical protein [Chloroflexota bacterium]
MSTKTEKVWVIVHENTGLLYYTLAEDKEYCMSKFINAAPPRRSWQWWMDAGYRCVRATITYEVPDER